MNVVLETHHSKLENWQSWRRTRVAKSPAYSAEPSAELAHYKPNGKAKLPKLLPVLPPKEVEILWAKWRADKDDIADKFAIKVQIAKFLS